MLSDQLLHSMHGAVEANKITYFAAELFSLNQIHRILYPFNTFVFSRCWVLT